MKKISLICLRILHLILIIPAGVSVIPLFFVELIIRFIVSVIVSTTLYIFTGKTINNIPILIDEDNWYCITPWTLVGKLKNYIDKSQYIIEKEEDVIKNTTSGITNNELIKKLSKFPKDAVVLVECCDVKNIKYNKKDNTIRID